MSKQSSQDKFLTLMSYAPLISSFLLESVETKQLTAAEKKQLTAGLAVEREHKDLYTIFKKFAAEHSIAMPLSEEEFYTTIALAHIKEIPDYYVPRLKNMEDAAKKAVKKPIKEAVENRDLTNDELMEHYQRKSMLLDDIMAVLKTWVEIRPKSEIQSAVNVADARPWRGGEEVAWAKNMLEAYGKIKAVSF